MKVVYLLIVFFVFTTSLSSVEISHKPNEVIFDSVNRKIPNSTNVDIFAQGIYWTVREAGADAWSEVILKDSLHSTNTIRSVDFGWNAGFKVGLGHTMCHDRWNVRAYYTRFQTTGKDSIASEKGAVHSTFLGNFYVDNPIGLGLSGPSYQSASINWKIRFNTVDIDLGKKFFADKPFVIYPFLGIKLGWIDQSIHSRWENPDVASILYFNYGVEDIKNNYWGIGPKVGIDTKWNLYTGPSELYLFGNVSIAPMWGHWSFFDLYQNDLSQKVTVQNEDINSGSSMFDMFMGLGLKRSFRQNKTQYYFQLGYEMQFWLDQLKFYSFTGGRLTNMLTLQGATLEVYFDF